MKFLIAIGALIIVVVGACLICRLAKTDAEIWDSEDDQ